MVGWGKLIQSTSLVKTNDRTAHLGHHHFLVHPYVGKVKTQKSWRGWIYLLCLIQLFYKSVYKYTTSRQPRKLKFGMQASFNPTSRNIKKKGGSPHIGLSLKLAVLLQGKL